MSAADKLQIAVSNMKVLHEAARQTSADIEAEANAHAEKARLKSVPVSEHAGAKF